MQDPSYWTGLYRALAVVYSLYLILALIDLRRTALKLRNGVRDSLDVCAKGHPGENSLCFSWIVRVVTLLRTAELWQRGFGRFMTSEVEVHSIACWNCPPESGMSSRDRWPNGLGGVPEPPFSHATQDDEVEPEKPPIASGSATPSSPSASPVLGTGTGWSPFSVTCLLAYRLYTGFSS